MRSQPQLQPTLTEAIEALYQVFSAYALEPHVPGCTHCVFSEDHALIHSAPLRALSSKALEKYAFKAMTTWGTSEDFRHFLPRLLELQAQSTLNPAFVEITFGKLDYAHWGRWPEEERSAIRRYFMALWTDVLGTRPVDEDLSNYEAVSYLCAFSCAGEALEPYLSVWSEVGAQHKQGHFRAAVDWFGDSLEGQGRLPGSFWDPQPSQEVRAWFAREGTWTAFGLTRPW